MPADVLLETRVGSNVRPDARRRRRVNVAIAADGGGALHPEQLPEGTEEGLRPRLSLGLLPGRLREAAAAAAAAAVARVAVVRVFVGRGRARRE